MQESSIPAPPAVGGLSAPTSNPKNKKKGSLGTWIMSAVPIIKNEKSYGPCAGASDKRALTWTSPPERSTVTSNAFTSCLASPGGGRSCTSWRKPRVKGPVAKHCPVRRPSKEAAAESLSPTSYSTQNTTASGRLGWGGKSTRTVLVRRFVSVASAAFDGVGAFVCTQLVVFALVVYKR